MPYYHLQVYHTVDAYTQLLKSNHNWTVGYTLLPFTSLQYKCRLYAITKIKFDTEMSDIPYYYLVL